MNKENKFVIIYILAISTITLTNKQTNKQANKQTLYYFNDIQAVGLHIMQCYNIYKTVIIMMIKIYTIKAMYIAHRGPCTPRGKMIHKRNLDHSQKPLLTLSGPKLFPLEGESKICFFDLLFLKSP